MWLNISPKKQKKAIIARGRLIEREFGFEYTPFEMQQIKKFDNAKKTDLVEIDGFVSWLDRRKFLLLPTRTTNAIHIICRTIDGLNLPANNQFVHCKGRWKHALGKSVYKILVVDDIYPAKPEYGQLRSDINSSEFQKSLFENWRNIDSIQQNFLTQYFISSPPLPNRMGGITVSLFNAPRELKVAKALYKDLRMSVAPELLGSKKMTFDIPELARKHELVRFNWREKSSDFENISKSVQNSLRRRPSQNVFEQSIALLSQKHKPENFESLGLAKSDYPVTLEEHVERKGSPYISLKTTQFLIATHLNSPSIELKTHDESLPYVRDEIKKFVDVKNDLAPEFFGTGKMLDLDFNGKPMSILNLAISRQRTLSNDTVDKDAIISTTNDYIDNLHLAFKIWDDTTQSGALNTYINPLSLNEQKIVAFLDKAGPHTFNEICKATDLSPDTCSRTINRLRLTSIIYQFSQTQYDTVHHSSR